jgi:hypothetical protein
VSSLEPDRVRGSGYDIIALFALDAMVKGALEMFLPAGSDAWHLGLVIKTFRAKRLVS